MLIENNDSVRENTPGNLNRKVDIDIKKNLNHYYNNPSGIEKRLKELDTEWDIERTLELNAAALSFTGLLLGITVHRKWFLLPLAVTSFLAQHAVRVGALLCYFYVI